VRASGSISGDAVFKSCPPCQTAKPALRLGRSGSTPLPVQSADVRLSMITGRAWRDLPIVIILGLVIGLVFGPIVKLLPSEPTNSSLRTPRQR
jgi:hypothetical protein